MPLRAVLLSAVLLAGPPPTLCRRDLTLGDIVRNLTADTSGASGLSAEHRAISSGLERLQSRLAALQERLEAGRPAPGGCPVGWSRHGSSCYLVPGVTATWFGANVLCPSLDRRARLASVHLDNHQFVEDLVAASDAPYIWVGGNKLRLGGNDWGWQDGTPFDYANWASGQPNIGTELCLEIQGPTSTYDAQTGQWHDVSCTAGPYRFICQIKTDTE